MSEISSSPGDDQPSKPPARSKRMWHVFLIVLCIGYVLWAVVSTEMRVVELRGQGFSDVAISSVRNHAYFPMIGAILGAALFIGIGAAIKRQLRKAKD